MPDAMQPSSLRDCDSGSPLWPCAMTGACGCLAGIPDLAVVVHGSSGCFFYPGSLLPVPLFTTLIHEREVIFGSLDRLAEVLGSIPPSYRRVAVVTTCVPAVTGEEIREVLPDGAILVDSPGFSGRMEEGYRRGLLALDPEVDPDAGGINIAGANLLDPFNAGNLREAERLLALAGAGTGTLIPADLLDRLSCCGPLTVTVNPGLPHGAGEPVGSLLGLPAVKEAFSRLGDLRDDLDVGPVLREADLAEERILRATGKYLRRFDPPRAAVFGGCAYALHAAGVLKRYMDADITLVGSRNGLPPASRFPAAEMAHIGGIAEFLGREKPDLVLGSSFERSACPGAAFVPIAPPARGRVQLRSRALAGIEGALTLMEEVLNACMDMNRGKGG